MSLKCPLSTLRIDIPCRSSICSHNQCFDASSFLQLQEQAPTWTCPVCNKAVLFDHLQVDQYVNFRKYTVRPPLTAAPRYVLNILDSTPKSADQVTIEPNGHWLQTSGNDPSPPRTSNGRASSDDDDDLVEINDMPRVASVKTEVTREPGLMQTPPISSTSREQSSSSAPPPHPLTNKRPASQVVDLTLSSDEDEEPPRAAKRQLTHRLSTGLARIPSTENVPLLPDGAIGGVSRQQTSNPFGNMLLPYSRT